MESRGLGSTGLRAAELRPGRMAFARGLLGIGAPGQEAAAALELTREELGKLGAPTASQLPSLR